MNKIKLIVIAIFMSASTAVIAAEGFQLVSETEYREQTLKIRETERSEDRQSSFSTERFMGAPVRPASNSTTQKTLLL
jgi:hypothetical protein